MTPINRRRATMTMLAAAATVPGRTRAQGGFPTRPVTLLVPLAPGGDTDIMARLVAQPMSRELGQPVVVENRAGGGGLLAMQAVANANPDGHTLVMAFQAAAVIVPHLRLNPPYDPVRSFTPIGRVATTANALVVSAESPITSLQDLLARARREPDKLSYGSWGVGSGGHIVGEVINSSAGIRTQHVPYKGTTDVVRALIAKEVDYGFLGYGLATTQTRAGKVRVLAVLAPERSPLWPDAPTAREAGFDFMQEGWFGVMAPAGLPADIRQRLESALMNAASSAEFAEKVSAMTISPAPRDGKTFEQILKRESEMWRQWLAKAGLPKT
jgi:tripartite-type tricarboxylate transporter receptor subunit TctC